MSDLNYSGVKIAAESHRWETCPVFGGCEKCRSAKFKKASPDVKLGPVANLFLRNTSRVRDPRSWESDPRPVPFRDPKGAHNPVPALVPTSRPDLGPDSASFDLDHVEPTFTEIAAFGQAANESLERSRRVCNVRGDEYGDSWALGNIVTTYLDVVLDLLGIRGLELDEKRLLESASIVDVKEARIKNGSWKRDNSDDGINYRAAFATWYTEYEAG